MGSPSSKSQPLQVFLDGGVEAFGHGLRLTPLGRGHGVAKLLKGVEHRDAGRLEVADVAGDHGQSVFEGRCGD